MTYSEPMVTEGLVQASDLQWAAGPASDVVSATTLAQKEYYQNSGETLLWVVIFVEIFM